MDCREWCLVRRRLGGVAISVGPMGRDPKGSRWGKIAMIAMLDCSRMPGAHLATAASTGRSRAIVVRPTAVPNVLRPDRSVCRSTDAERISRPYLPRPARLAAHREQETHR